MCYNQRKQKLLTWQLTVMLISYLKGGIFKKKIIMYKIGEFSKIVDIPIRTLRYYAESGVLVPSMVDKYTGYKYYNDDNIYECEIIKLLKVLDFTLDEIKEYKTSINDKAIESKKNELEERINLLKLKYEQLNVLQNIIQDGRVYSLYNELEARKMREDYERKINRKNN